MNDYKYSITFRPLLEIFESIDSPLTYFEKLFDKISNKYIISLEKGNSEEINHLQIYIDLEETITQKALRKRIVRYINPLNIDKGNLKIALKVKEIKSNFEGVIGYVLKEDNEKNIKGFSDEEITTYRNVYLEHSSKESNKKDYFRINKKNYHIYVSKWIENNPQKYKSFFFTDNNINKYLITEEEEREITREVIKRIIDTMIIEDYYFTFLSSRNIREIIEYLYFFLNKKEGFCDYLLDIASLQ